jgi:hypothetical protein
VTILACPALLLLSQTLQRKAHNNCVSFQRCRNSPNSRARRFYPFMAPVSHEAAVDPSWIRPLLTKAKLPSIPRG